jgi:antitoxin CcdA
MKTSTENRQPQKRPVNLLLSEESVQQAREYTSNLSATVEALLLEYVERERAARLTKQQLGDAISEAWNQFRATHGAYADEHSTL